MADFSSLSETDDSTVEELLSQAMDSAVLDQIVAINCAGFTDSALPTHLETRFRKLKSFPATQPAGKKASLSSSFNAHHHSVETPKTHVENESNDSVDEAKSESDSVTDDEKKDPVLRKGLSLNPKLGSGSVSSSSKSSISSAETGNGDFSKKKKTPVQKKGLKLNPKLESGSVSSSSSKSSVENGNLARLKKKSGGKMGLKSKSRGGSSSSPSNSWSSSMKSRSPSPPLRTGCLWCSPKKDSRRRKKSRDSGDWGKTDELLSDLNAFSAKEQIKVLKKAMEEQKRVRREAEKIVKWAKQASARMDVSAIEDELSDNDSLK